MQDGSTGLRGMPCHTATNMQAASLVGADLSEEQLNSLKNVKKGLNARDLLAKYTRLTDLTQPTQAILLDMHIHTLQFGQEIGLAGDKLSGLFSIMKSVHTKSTQDKMPVDRSFTLFKDLLLKHSVHRPPRSIGLFTQQEFKQILNWGLDTYYRHYKLYQYAFTDRVILSVTQQHPSDSVEIPPAAGLQPLQDAMTQDEHNEVVSKSEEEAAEQARAEAEAAEAAAEAERQARLREEYEAAIPDEIRERVAAAVEKELAVLRETMESRFQAQQEALLAKVTVLEAKLGPA